MDTNKLTELAKQVLADAGDALSRPWMFELQEGATEPNRKYMETAANSAEILAKAVLIQQEALKKIQSIDVETNEPLQADCSIIASQCFTKVNALMGEK